MIRFLAGLFGGASMLPWFVLGGVLAAFSLSGAAYFKGRSDAAARCQEAALRAEMATMKRDFAAWKAANEADQLLQSQIDADRKQLEERVKEYEAELSKRPDSRCALSKHDIDRLRLRGI